MLGTPYGGRAGFTAPFVQSWTHFQAYDAQRGQFIFPNNGGFLFLETTNLPHGRNQIVKEFLRSGFEWLWFCDDDQSFEPNVLERMMATADAKERPIVGTLIFSYNAGDFQTHKPTLWTIGEGNQPMRFQQVPPPGVYPLLTGTGCVVIHRSVFEGVAAAKVPGSDKTWGETSWPWFEYSEWVNADGAPDVFGEDLTFMVRALAAGFVPHVDTRIEVGHRKQFTADLRTYTEEQQRIAAFEAQEDLPTFVVIPVKGQEQLTKSLLRQLVEQGGYERIFVYDNAAGTDEAAPSYGDAPGSVTTIPAAGMNIHEMWNAGIERALELGGPDCNIAILNNDLRIGPEFLSGLRKVLRSDPRIGAVSPNYDGRDGAWQFQQVHGIAANRYDGTGGLAGFAFMVRGDLFSAGFPMFDTGFQWWFGDNDFTLNLDKHGYAYGIATRTTVEHLDGGSKSTVHDAAFEAQVAKDRERFCEKWNARLVSA